MTDFAPLRREPRSPEPRSLEPRSPERRSSERRSSERRGRDSESRGWGGEAPAAMGDLDVRADGPPAMSDLRVQVNPIACVAHASCAELLPERITLDEWGYPIVDGEPVPAALVPHARRAVNACPTLALRLDAILARQPT